MDTAQIIKYIPLLIPVVVLELGLMIAGLVDLVRRPHTRGPKWVWLIVILINFIGPIIYFVAGRKEE